MDGKSNALTFDEDVIPKNISIGRATPVRAKIHRATRITANLDPPARTIASRSTYMECNGSPEYMADKVLDHRRKPEDLENKISWYGYTTEEDT